MKSLAVHLLSVLLIQATTCRPANDEDEYEKHEEHSITYSSSNKPVRSQTLQTIMRAPTFPTMNFGLNPGRQSFSSSGSGGLSGFSSFNPFPTFPSFEQLSAGVFGGLSGQSPGGFGKLSGFFQPGSTGSSGFAQAGSTSSNSQGNMKPLLTFTQTSSNGPGSNQVSAGSQSSTSQNGQTSEEEPSIVFNFD